MRAIGDWTRTEVEDYLFHEAALLDQWRLPEWRGLFADDCHYYVPNMGGDPYASPEQTLYLISDDGHHLTERVKRLGKKTAHAEYPHSITQRIVSNVRLLPGPPNELKATSNFITHRTANGVTDAYFGRHEYRMVQRADSLLILEKRSILAMGALRPHGKLSIIV
ncbi:3-phenylpropionate/cinnamic acid dioxygenase subunit beta [soil metagenome]